MTRRVREPFRSSVSPAAQRRSVTETAEFRASTEQSQRDRIGLQEKFERVDEELEEHDQVTQLTGGFIHISLDAGVATVESSLNLEAGDVAFDMAITVVAGNSLATPYAVHVQNQLDLSNGQYFSLSREETGFTIRATDAAFVPLDMSVGVHQFSALVLGAS